MTELARTNQGVVLHHAGEVEILVGTQQMFFHSLEHLWSEVFTELLVLWHHLDGLYGIVLDILSGHHELGKAI